VLPPSARLRTRLPGKGPMRPAQRVVHYQRARGLRDVDPLSGSYGPDGVPDALTPRQARRVKHKTGCAIARGQVAS